MTLNVVIIGAGIAGLTSAAVLRSKANVTILERSSEERIRGGQGLGLGPNSVRILEQLGFDRVRARACVSQGLKAYDASTGEIVKSIPMNMAAQYGDDWLMTLREDLRSEIKRLATEEGVGETPTIRYNVKVQNVDVDEGIVTLEDGETVSGDVIIIGAGIHSTLKKKILGDGEFDTTPTGQSIFRFLISAENATKAVGELPEWWNPAAGAYLSIMRPADGSNRAMISYPCSNFAYRSFSCAFPNDCLSEQASESWFADGDINQVKEIFKDFPTPYTKLMEYAEEVKVWELRDHDPFPTYVKGRAVLIGDAAHAMAPFQGQGAGQAIEDAEGFRLLIELDAARADVPKLLERWNTVRKPRASQVQLNTRAASKKLNEIDSMKNMTFNWTYSGIFEELKRIEN